MIVWFLLFVVCVYLWVKDKQNRSQLDYLPGPRVYPFIGGGFELAFGSPADYLKTLSKWWDLYGTRFRIFLGRDLRIVISDPIDVEVVLSGQEFIEKSADYDFMKPWLGEGLLISTGEKWKKHRRVLTPAFHFKILENFVNVFDAQSTIFVEKLNKLHADHMPFDIYPYIALCALDIICETAMGVSINAQNDSESFYVNAVKNACNLVNGRIRNPLTRIDSIFRLTKNYGILSKSLETLHGYTDTMIMERRKLIEESKEDLASYTESCDVYGGKKKMAFMDLLLMSTIDGKPLTDLEIREEVDTFLFEGHDTISSAIGFALHILSNHPEIQDKLYSEQTSIFTDNVSRAVNHSDLQEMKYLELVVKETLRMYPSVPMIGRKVDETTYINDMKIPKGASILILCYNMNRNSKLFPEPDKFIPERFLPEESRKRNPFSSVYFSAGPRNCIGQRFAMLEMKTTLSKLVRNFEIGPVNEPLELSADLILKSVHGIKIKLKSRTKTQ